MIGDDEAGTEQVINEPMGKDVQVRFSLITEQARKVDVESLDL